MKKSKENKIGKKTTIKPWMVDMCFYGLIVILILIVVFVIKFWG